MVTTVRVRVPTIRIHNRLFALPYEVDPPGVVDGVLVDPQAYFFWLIGRQPDQPADDWEQVLRASGLPPGNPPHVKPTDNGFYGLTQQIGSDPDGSGPAEGRIAGRIFLPTATADDLGYYAHPVSPLKDAPQGGGHLLWEWRSLGGPPYVPVNSSGTTPTPVPPPSGGGLTEDQVRAIVAEATATCIRVDETIALVSSGDVHPGSLLCAEGGGPEEEGQPFTLTARNGDNAPGPWESWRVRRGQ